MKKLVCIIALLCAVAVQADAQDLKGILSGVAKAVVGDKATTAASLVGTWDYVGPDCQLKGDDVLTNIGGEAAGEEVEEKVEAIYNKAGLNTIQFTFNEDNTCSYTVKGKKAKTFVYRIHEQPLPEKLEDFNRFVARFGYGVKTGSRKALTTSMNNLMAEVREKPEQSMIQTLAVRTMAKAEYSTDNIGHYGLAFDYYTHFTSPIRRYPDVMVHRLLQRYLEGGRSANKEKYEEFCKHSSEMEQVAANAERASIKYKQVEFMADKVGQVFDGTISGVTQWGFYVELDDSKCEGLVSMTELEDDAYEFDEKNYCIVGRYHHKSYQLGDKVKVRVAKANLVARQLDPDLADKPKERMKEFENLVARTHKAGLKFIIDFVPNHVARQYKSDNKPLDVKDLGEDDNKQHAFNQQNNFYYIPDQLFYPNFDLKQDAPSPYYEMPARATGNDNFSSSPNRNDWYETIKLNYGVDFCGGKQCHFQPTPSTWLKMRDILLYWASKGIDGFRCDMAEMVNVPLGVSISTVSNTGDVNV